MPPQVSNTLVAPLQRMHSISRWARSSTHVISFQKMFLWKTIVRISPTGSPLADMQLANWKKKHGPISKWKKISYHVGIIPEFPITHYDVFFVGHGTRIHLAHGFSVAPFGKNLRLLSSETLTPLRRPCLSALKVQNWICNPVRMAIITESFDESFSLCCIFSRHIRTRFLLDLHLGL